MKKAILIIGIAVVVVGLGIFLAVKDAKGPTTENPWANKSTRDLALTCLDREYTVQHIHPHLTLMMNGQTREVPADIGIEEPNGATSHEEALKQAGCLHPIHTHDASGTIHVESPEPRDFTLGDFFAVWQEPFSKDQILDFKADDSHAVTMTVNGQPNDAYDQLILKDEDQIVIRYGSK